MITSREPSQLPASESFLSVEGVEWHVIQDGPRDAPTLLLIHGTAASARSWEPMLPLLSTAHRVVRIDLLGCGESGVPADGNYGVADQAVRIGKVLDDLEVGSAVIIGHSSGGAFATALAEARPDLVRALVLINTGPDMSAYITQEVAVAVPSWHDLTDDQIREAISDGFHPGFAIPQAYVDQFREINFQSFAAISVAIRGYLDQRSLPERLAGLDKPLLVIFGEEDLRWRASSAQDYRVVPDAKIEMLPGLGHSPNLEDPERTTEVLLAFTDVL